MFFFDEIHERKFNDRLCAKINNGKIPCSITCATFSSSFKNKVCLNISNDLPSINVFYIFIADIFSKKQFCLYIKIYKHNCVLIFVASTILSSSKY